MPVFGGRGTSAQTPSASETPEEQRFSNQGNRAKCSWSAVGDVHALDPELMDWARANDHIILTHDLDFGTLLAQTRASRPSVVTVRADDPGPVAIGNQVLGAIQQHATDLGSGALVMVDVSRSRVRVLPI